jgi:ElaB/YqjD/DUF883 family membrane-anchored ribosome-binding protein
MDNEEMNHEKEAIHEKMEETKNSIADKLEVLEQKMSGPVDAVTETVQAVKDTVESVKEHVEGTAEAVQEAVHDGVESVRHWFDITQHVQNHPWVVMGCSVGAGFLMQSLLFSGRASVKKVESEPHAPATTNGHGATSHHARRRREHKKSWLDELTPALSQIKSLAMGALFGSIRKMVTQSVSPQIGTVVGDIIDKVASKLGGDAADSHKEESWSPDTTKGKRNDQYTDPNPAEMGRPMGSARWQG